MRYAVNDYDVAKIAQDLLNYTQRNRSKTWWAIVDRGFDYDTPNKLVLSGFKHFFAYQEDLIDLHRISPVLISLSSVRENRQNQLLQLLTHCKGKPMLSFISTPFPEWGLERKIRSMQKFRAPEGEEYFLRFADTRTLEALEHILLEDNYRYFGYGFTEWVSLGRDGELVHYKFDKYPRDEDKSYDYLDRLNANQRMHLQEQEFYQTLEYSESDRIFQHLFEHHFEYFEHRNSYGLLQDIRAVRSYLETLSIQDTTVALYLVFILNEAEDRSLLEQEDFKSELLASSDRELFVKSFYAQYESN